MNKATRKFTVTALLDNKSNIITAFFDDLPGLVVQGSNESDVKNKLQDLLKLYIKRLQSIGNDFEITTKSIA
jgi:predicted RNase H-like HicB family nuclease